MKVIFLDVDGVLNSARSWVAGKGKLEQYHIENPDDPHYRRVTKCTIDPIACELINEVCKETDAKLVISSTHRKHFPKHDEVEYLNLLKEYFGFLGINPDLVIGATPSLHTARGAEIKYWLDNNPHVTHFAIVDDSSDMLESQMDNFVRVDPEIGFTFEDFKKVSALLGKEQSCLIFI